MDKIDFSNISITAYRVIHIIKMLLKKPCGINEISDELCKNNFSQRALSQDTIGIYINTLKKIGCEISRPSKKNDYKYVLQNHPFSLSLTKEELDTLNIIKNNAIIQNNWEFIYEIVKLNNELYRFLSKENSEYFKSIENSRFKHIFKKINLSQLEKMKYYCNENYSLSIKYDSPRAGEEIFHVIADEIFLENNKLYFVCYNGNTKEYLFLRMDRIKEIIEAKEELKYLKKDLVLVRYVLNGYTALLFNQGANDKIIEKNINHLIVETKVKNKFLFVQKMLSYGKDCKILYPNEFIKHVENKLKDIVSLYEK